VNEAKREGKEVHMARIHGICVEKNYQLPKGDPKRKFKGRGVLLGNQVKNQHWEAAFFQDLGNSPATFEAARWADYYGCLPGHNVQLTDAIQAYIQAKLTGPACWVELPDDAWPDDIDFKKFRRPVVRLVKALYGHPDSGTMWEQHCDKHVCELNFVPMGEEWPSMYFHKELKLMLVIYADDLKMAGPKENLKKGWEMLRTKLKIEPETELGLYLGCNLSKGQAKLYDGTSVATMTYDMEGLLKLSVEKYLDIVGKDTKLKIVSTPSLPDETKQHKSRTPTPGDPKKSVSCPWCSHKFDPAYLVNGSSGTGEKDVSSPDAPRGELAPHAASMLMKLLYAARIARFDLLRSINNLARNVTKWSINDDAQLYHLMCYVNSTLKKRMIGWVGDSIEEHSIALYADADFAGCSQSLRSTSGSHMHIQGKHTRFPLAGGSKRQGCVSHSTPEAEIVAADVTLRTMGLPSISIWETITGRHPQILFHDDNQGMIGVVRSGKNPTMRHLERTHGILITSLHEQFINEHFVLMYEITAKMAADIHTKGFRNPLAWQKACWLINLLEPQDLSSKLLADLVSPTTDVDTTKRQVFQSKTDQIPNFPYTETPILPPEVYRPGLTAKEKLQQVPGMDPIFVVKTPVLYRKRPAGTDLPWNCTRSTWVLLNKKWTKVEDHAEPVQQSERFDKWVERACFQYHPPNQVASAMSATRHQSAAGEDVVHDPPALTVGRRSATSHESAPQLMVSTEALLSATSDNVMDNFASIHVGAPQVLRMINTLLHIVHGGSDGAHLSTIVDRYATPVVKEKNENEGKDLWEYDKTNNAITRIHKIGRRTPFVPHDVDDCPVSIHSIKDERTTTMKYQSSERSMDDNWRLCGNNNEVTNRRNEFWTGKTVFSVAPSAKIQSDDQVPETDGSRIRLCVGFPKNRLIPLKDLFVGYKYRMNRTESKPNNEGKEKIILRLIRNDKKYHEVEFVRSPTDLATTDYTGYDIRLEIEEIPKDVPILTLMCAEVKSNLTKLHAKIRDPEFLLVTITEDDNLLSPYGRWKWKRCVRSELDGVFFAGPCAGGSPWNRLNKRISEITAHQIRMKASTYWKLWEEFMCCLDVVTELGGMGLIELPRGCDYWRDSKMIGLIEGTINHVQDFDGCMYGLRAEHSKTKNPIKKPWRVVSWRVKIDGLDRKCDGSHEHDKCEGKDTKLTQLYTSQIVGTIYRAISRRIIRRERENVKSFGIIQESQT